MAIYSTHLNSLQHSAQHYPFQSLKLIFFAERSFSKNLAGRVLLEVSFMDCLFQKGAQHTKPKMCLKRCYQLMLPDEC